MNDAIRDVGLDPASALPSEIYERQTDIRRILAARNDKEVLKTKKGFPAATTGWITERICQYGLQSVIPDSYSRLGRDEKWIADFNVIGYPVGAVISVKSFTAKERLLASALGMILVPTIGFGWFKNADEFKAIRCVSYRDRGFLAIYMPEETLAAVDVEARSARNINGTLLLRGVLDMPGDFRAATHCCRYGQRTLHALNTRKL